MDGWMDGWGALTWQPALVALMKASNISQLKEFAGEVFNMVGSICRRLLRLARLPLRCSGGSDSISAITACHEEQSRLEITQTAVFKDQT